MKYICILILVAACSTPKEENSSEQSMLHYASSYIISYHQVHERLPKNVGELSKWMENRGNGFRQLPENIKWYIDSCTLKVLNANSWVSKELNLRPKYYGDTNQYYPNYEPDFIEAIVTSIENNNKLNTLNQELVIQILDTAIVVHVDSKRIYLNDPFVLEQLEFSPKYHNGNIDSIYCPPCWTIKSKSHLYNIKD